MEVLDTLRKPLFVAALVLIAIALLVEIGAKIVSSFGESIGFGIPYTAFLDALLVYVIVLMALSLLMPKKLHGRLTGIATLVVSFLLAIASFVAIFVAFYALMAMVTLLLSAPFGTIAYLAIYGHFPRGEASVTLGALMALKLLFAACLLLAHQSFLQNKGLVVLVLFSLLAGIIVSFLHRLVPGVLVSIADAASGIVLGVIALLWAVWFLLRSIPSIYKALRVDRAA